MNSTPGVVVIGAGPAGLAAAAELGRMGLPAAVLEQADSVGASWRGRYDRLRLNTCRWTSQLPRSRYPPHTALFPSRDDVISYLKDYAARHVPGVRAGTRVDRIDRHPAGWELHTSAGPQAASQVIVARHVIVATGRDHTPHMPSWPGHDRYTGRLLHAAAYRNARPFRDARVAVAGAGCSGLEIAYDLTEGGADRVRVNRSTRPASSSPAERASRQTSSSRPPATRPGSYHWPGTSACSTSAASHAATAGKPQPLACASSATSPGPARSARSAAKPGGPPRQSRTRSQPATPGHRPPARPDPRQKSPPP